MPKPRRIEIGTGKSALIEGETAEQAA